MTEYAEGSIRFERLGAVAVVTIDRPHVRNALDNASAVGLGQAMRDFDAEPDLSVAVLTGAHGAFCAGADLKAVADDANYVAWAGDPEGPTAPTLSKPVIAAVEGHAVAGGLGIALWCDIRVVDETAVFGVFCRRWGVPMSDGTTVRLPRLIGTARALDMLITGRGVPAAEAIDWGLATRMAPKGETLETAVELAHEIARFPQIAMRSDRMSAYRQHGLTLEEAVRVEKELSQEAKAKEAQAGAARFAAGAGRHGAAAED